MAVEGRCTQSAGKSFWASYQSIDSNHRDMHVRVVSCHAARHEPGLWGIRGLFRGQVFF